METLCENRQVVVCVVNWPMLRLVFQANGTTKQTIEFELTPSGNWWPPSAPRAIRRWMGGENQIMGPLRPKV